MAKYSVKYGLKKQRRWPYLAAACLVFISTGFFMSTRAPATDSALVTDTVNYVLDQSATADEATPQPKIIDPLPWPSYGQAAYGVTNDGVLATSTDELDQVPIASLAKVITALVILDKKPLVPGEQGPNILLTENDEALYREYVAKNGTVTPVKAGIQISQYQALQAVLMHSANNISDTLVNWAFGSMEEYIKYANDFIQEYGLTDTTIADASGYSPDTKSTAADMVKAGILYVQNPVLREIAQQPNTLLPFAGAIYNKNAVHNEERVLGIKIGFTEQAGRTFLVADLRGDSDKEIAVASVLGADTMTTAMRDAETLLKKGNKSHDGLLKPSH